MMRLSTKGRYGSRLMLELALNYGKGAVLLKDIARRQEISEGYLEHIVPPLKVAGLIKSTRGAHGGYMLAKNPSEINLKDVVGTLEGSLYPVECVDNPDICHRVPSCVTRDIWQKLGDNISQTLESITLNDMVQSQNSRTETQFLYHI